MHGGDAARHLRAQRKANLDAWGGTAAAALVSGDCTSAQPRGLFSLGRAYHPVSGGLSSEKAKAERNAPREGSSGLCAGAVLGAELQELRRLQRPVRIPLLLCKKPTPRAGCRFLGTGAHNGLR